MNTNEETSEATLKIILFQYSLSQKMLDLLTADWRQISLIDSNSDSARNSRCTVRNRVN